MEQSDLRQEVSPVFLGHPVERLNLESHLLHTIQERLVHLPQRRVRFKTALHWAKLDWIELNKLSGICPCEKAQLPVVHAEQSLQVCTANSFVRQQMM